MSLAFFKKDDVAIVGKTASYPSTADSGNINTRLSGHERPSCPCAARDRDTTAITCVRLRR
jgi:hypothetical protein